MKNILTVTIVVIIIILLSFNILKDKTENNSFGSIVDSNAYISTTTNSTWSEPDGFKLIKSGNGTLGSVVVTGTTNTGSLYLYDATSTFNHANYPTSTLAVILPSTPAGTYTFDVAFSRGLFAVWSGHAGGVASSTITSR